MINYSTYYSKLYEYIKKDLFYTKLYRGFLGIITLLYLFITISKTIVPVMDDTQILLIVYFSMLAVLFLFLFQKVSEEIIQRKEIYNLVEYALFNHKNMSSQMNAEYYLRILLLMKYY